MEPVAKKLRCSEADLKVVLGSGDDETVQWHHSIYLACKSKYIDAMLAAPMREKEERTITFPDIDLETWQKMLKFLDSPLAARKMSAPDALELAVWYDKYEFGQGRELCEEVISEFLTEGTLTKLERDYSLDIDFIIDLVKVARKANLNAPFEKGMKYIMGKMRAHIPPYDSGMFNKGRMTTLAPLLRYARDNGLSIAVRMSTYGLDPDSEYFPDSFVDKDQLLEAQLLLTRCVSRIEICGTRCDADGLYEQEEIRGDLSFVPLYGNESSWGSQAMYRFSIERNKERNWAIVREVEPTEFLEDGGPDPGAIVVRPCWMAPYSSGRMLPPLTGWVSTDPLARGQPKLNYILVKSVQGL
ncbi:hypothetical protein ACHAWF_005008 [Thalassiosira exigua]